MTANNAINNTLQTPFNVGATSVTSTGTQLNLLNALTVVPINKVKVTVVSATNASWTPTAGMVYMNVEGVGGGATQLASGTGGGYAGYFKKTWTAANVGASLNITIGAAGAQGAAGQHDGGTGGDTTVVPAGTGSTLTGSGGVGGASQGVQAPGAGGITFSSMTSGAGGAASGGDINVPGAPGLFGLGDPTGGATMGGQGGSGIWGAGGQPQINGAGADGLGNGSGGSGASANNSAQAAGGNGKIGLVVITEYLSA